MTDPNAAYGSRTFKKDKNAWVVLTLFAFAVFLGTWIWGETDRIRLRPWEGSVSDQATLTVLEYERVVSNSNKDHISQQDFKKQLKALEEDGYQAVSLTDVVNFYYEGKNLPEKSVLLIFANGYLETYAAVDPILRLMKWPAAMIVITETVVERETFFLYWDRLRRMVNSGVWSLVSGGHRRHGVLTNAKNNAVGEILSDYKISLDLMEANIPGVKLLAHSPVFKHAHNHMRKISLMALEEHAIKPFFQLGFMNSFVGVNDKNSDPFRLRRLRVKPDWKPETLLTLMKNGIQAVTAGRENTAQKESLWFEDDGELVDTSPHPIHRPGQNIRLAGTRNVTQGIRVHGVPGAELFFPAGNKAGNWVLEVDLRLDRGEFWVGESLSKTSSDWRVGGNSENMNVQIRGANGQYENLADSKAGIILNGWHHMRLVKRGNGIIVDWDGEALWNLPVYLQSDVKGDIVLKVWSRKGEASLGVSDAKISMVPDNIRWLQNFPEENDLQLLFKNVEKVSRVTTVTHTVQENQVKSVPFDNDLFQIISHRYAWDFIPTVSLLPKKKLSGKLDSEHGRKNETGNTGNFSTKLIKQLIQQNLWTRVHLDLSRLGNERIVERLSWIAELKNELEKINCLLHVTTEGRPDVDQSLPLKSPLLDNDSKSSWLVAERSR